MEVVPGQGYKGWQWQAVQQVDNPMQVNYMIYILSIQGL